MKKYTAKTARDAEFLPLVRELVRTYQAFAVADARLLAPHGLTGPQADVMFTLGNTAGMTFKQLGEKTLITKGTLTGIVDRLETKGLVKRVACPEDGRSWYAVLTAKGETWFAKVFPEHIANLHRHFAALTPSEIKQATATLKKIRSVF